MSVHSCRAVKEHGIEGALKKTGIHITIGGRIWRRWWGGVSCHGGDLFFFRGSVPFFEREGGKNKEESKKMIGT